MSTLNVQAIDPSQMMKQLDLMIKLKEPALLWGSPGCGKSTIVADWCKNNGYNITIRMLSQIAPGDLMIPYIDKGVLKYAIADWLVDLGKEGKHILFLDEIDKVAPDVRTSIFQLLLDRRLAHWQMPENVIVVAAGNRITDNAGGYEMDTALADRAAHYLIEPNAQQWLQWALDSNIHPTVLTFIKTRPDLLDDSDNFDDLVRVSPRSWQKISDILWETSKPEEVSLQTRIGLQNTAIFFQTLEEIQSLPDLTGLKKATDEELVSMGRTMFDTHNKVYGLAYALHATSTTVKQLASAARIFVNVCNGLSLSSSEDFKVMGLNLLLNKAFQKGWILKLIEEPDMQGAPSQAIDESPDLKSLLASSNLA